MPPREPLGLGLQAQNKEKMKTVNKSVTDTQYSAFIPRFYVLSNGFTITGSWLKRAVGLTLGLDADWRRGVGL